jgi:hypothetical protein
VGFGFTSQGTEEVIPAKTQLNDALIESYPDSRFGQLSLASEPVWVWGCSVLDRQDAIKELLN